MKLHLVRHGKAEKDSASGKDFDRGLAPKGVAQSELLGDHLKINELNSTITVWCSDAARTRETLGGLRTSIPFTNVTYRKDLYLCSRDHLLDQIWQHSGKGDLMIIGHNFGISDLAEYFLEEFIELRTGEYISIHFVCDNWNETSKGTGIIADRFRASVDL